MGFLPMFSLIKPAFACSLLGCACIDSGLAAAMTLNRKGSLLENFLATECPRIPEGSSPINLSSGIRSLLYTAMDGPLGWVPIHISAMGLLAGDDSPRSSGIKLFDPQAYSWILFSKTPILPTDRFPRYSINQRFDEIVKDSVSGQDRRLGKQDPGI